MKKFLKVIAVVLCIAVIIPMYVFGWENVMTVITPPDQLNFYEGKDWVMARNNVVSPYGDLDLTGLVLGYNGEEVQFQTSRWGPNIFCTPVDGVWKVGDNEVYFLPDEFEGLCAQGTLVFKRIKNITVVQPPNDTTYIRGIDWDYDENGRIIFRKVKLDGILLKVVCTDDYTYYVENDGSVQWSVVADDYVLHVGHNQICARFAGAEAPFDIDIELESIISVSKNQSQSKTEYLYGTDWRYIRDEIRTDIDLSGLSITAAYNNGTKQVFSYDECPERFSLPENLNLSAGSSSFKVVFDSKFNILTNAFFCRYGDMDFSGTVNSSDALMILRSVAEISELSEKQLSFADVNDDGRVNSADALQVLNKSVGLIKYFDAEI